MHASTRLTPGHLVWIVMALFLSERPTIAQALPVAAEQLGQRPTQVFSPLGDGAFPAAAATSLVTFVAAHAEMVYFLRIQGQSGAVSECYTPCTLALPPGNTRVWVLAPRAFQRDIVLSGRATLVKVSHRSAWRYGVGGLLLGISLAEFIYGAVLFPWNGGGSTTAASTAAAAWAFGAIELTSASTLLALGGKNGLLVIDDPTRLKAEAKSSSKLRLAGLGVFAGPASSGVQASFRF